MLHIVKQNLKRFISKKRGEFLARLQYLFVFEDFVALGINNTTNLLDGRFTDLKLKLRCHQGMRKEAKIRFIKDYFSKLADGWHLFCPLGANVLKTAPILSFTPYLLYFRTQARQFAGNDDGLAAQTAVFVGNNSDAFGVFLFG